MPIALAVITLMMFVFVGLGLWGQRVAKSPDEATVSAMFYLFASVLATIDLILILIMVFSR